jgi:hypothetical protein
VFAFRSNRTALQCDESPHKVQTNACSLGELRLWIMDTVELLKKLANLIWLNADAFIVNLDAHCVVGIPR